MTQGDTLADILFNLPNKEEAGYWGTNNTTRSEFTLKRGGKKQKAIRITRK